MWVVPRVNRSETAKTRRINAGRRQFPGVGTFLAFQAFHIVFYLPKSSFAKLPAWEQRCRYFPYQATQVMKF